MEQPITFTERTRQFCIQAGVAAVIMSIISIIHYFVAAPEFHWLLLVLCIPNVCVLISGIFMANLNRWIIIMLGISLIIFVLYFLFVLLLMKNFIIVLSPSSFVLFVYTLVIMIYSLITDLHSKLQENYLARKEDADYWNGKI